MPQTINLKSVRGDEFQAALPLLMPTGPAPGDDLPPPTRPLTLTEAQAIKDTWPTIRMQVKGEGGALLFTLTSAEGELSIEPAYPQPDGTTAPALVLRGPHAKMTPAGSARYDIQFSTADGRPLTPIGGKFTLTQDTTDAPL